MTSDRKKPGVAFWASVVLVGLLIGYHLSFGPACWLASHTNASTDWLPFFYRPIASCLSIRKTRLSSAIEWYSGLGAAPGWRWAPDGIPLSDDEWVAVEWVWMSYARHPAAKGE